jgi:hypothetical protein
MADHGLVPILLGAVGLLAFAGGMTGIVVASDRARRVDEIWNEEEKN